MATRCNSTTKLEYHHKNRGGGAGAANGQLLCHDCHVATPTYGKAAPNGNPPPEFSAETKKEIHKNAGGKCECTRDNCH